MTVIVVDEGNHSNAVLAESYESAVNALIKEGFIDRYTEANGGYYGGSDLEDLYGDEWKEKILKDHTILEDLNICWFDERHLYTDDEFKEED